MKSRSRIVVLGLGTTLAMLAALVVVLATSQAASTAGARLTVRSTGYGKALFGPSGKVLYVFGADRGATSHCYGVCAKAWPPLLTTGKPLAGPGVRANLLGTTKRRNGTLQVTYNHHPLYTFVKDKRKGQTNGEGVNAFGGVWDAVSPAGAKVVRHPAPNPIPQHNGGDHDSDNNGGPSDGDGNI